jgi:hypothetical protein
MSIIDSSPKPKTVVLNNGASVSTLKSRFGGASLFLNGRTDHGWTFGGPYAYVASNTDFGFGTGDFTIEMWIYPLDLMNWRTLISVGSYTNGILWRMGPSTDQLYINYTSYNQTWDWGASSIPLHSWSHIALVRNNGVIKTYINGTETLSISGGAAASDLGSSREVHIGTGGHGPGSEIFNGYIDEVRITKGIGSAKYTSNFDVKTLYAPFPSSGTPVTPPNAPTDLVAGPLDRTINMIWNTPAEDNGGIITDYSIQHSTNGFDWIDFPHSPSVVTAISVTGLDNGTNYSVRVGAINYTGVQNYVSQSDLMPSVPPVDTNPDPYFYSTSLLLHFNGAHNSTTITDTSYLPKNGAVQGDAKLSIAKNKFGGSSIYFDGNGDYLTVPNHPGFDFGAEDFTIEYWEYRLGSGTGSVMCRVRREQGLNPWLLGHNESGTLKLYMSVDYNNWTISGLSMGSMIQNNWTHYAVVRQGNTVRTYQNGSQVSTASFTGTLPIGGGSLSIGRYADNNTDYFNGYLDDVRITRGFCRYPDGTTFPVPTLPFSDVAPTITAPEAPSSITAYGRDASAEVVFVSPASDKSVLVSYDLQYSEDLAEPSWTSVSSSPTRLLLHFNKADIRGNAKLKDYSLYNRNVLWNTTNNPAFIGGDNSSNYQKFGDGCLDIQYNRTNYDSPYIVKVDESSDLNPGTGDYTLEMFLMLDDPYTSKTIGRLFGSYNASSGSYFGIQQLSWDTIRLAKIVNGSGTYHVDIGGSVLRGNTNGPGNYNKKPIHLVFCRQNGTIRIYVNGNKVVDRADTDNDNFSAGGLVVMGGDSGSHYANNYLLGRMDELRYTIGEALYTGASIDVLPSSEFKNVKVTGIPNNKNYVFRIRGQNSGGYGDYATSSSVSVAPPPVLTITSEPVNTRVETYNANATFSITATISDASTPTYQWQTYSLDPNSNPCDQSGPEWRNISGSTASSLTINNSSFPYCNEQLHTNAVRCIVSSPYETKVSKTVRYFDISSVLGGMTFNTYQYDYNFDANYRGYFELSYYGYYDYYADLSWYSGSDTKLKFQYSSDNSTWINTDSAYHYSFRRKDLSYYQNYQIPPIDLSGTVYLRVILEDLWPYNTNNGTSSSTESPYSVVLSTFSYELYATAPTLMTNFSADPGDRLVVLSWTKGLSGGLPNSTTYSIEYSTDETNWEIFTDTLAFSNSSIYVTGSSGLINGTTYYFRMKAVNSVGSTSYTSTISATPNVSEATTPSVINNLTGVAGDGKAYLTWDSPASDGQSLPISYTVRYSRDGGSTWTNYP